MIRSLAFIVSLSAPVFSSPTHHQRVISAGLLLAAITGFSMMLSRAGEDPDPILPAITDFHLVDAVRDVRIYSATVPDSNFPRLWAPSR